MRALQGYFVFCLLLALLTAPAWAIDSSTLLARHKQAVFSDVDRMNSISTIEMTGTVERYGLQGNVGIYINRPDRFSLIARFPLMTEQEVIRGNQVEVLQPSGRVVQPSPPGQAETRVLQFVLGFRYLQLNDGLADNVREDGTSIIAQYRLENNLLAEITYDSRNYLITGFSFTDTMGRTHKWEMDSYQLVDGVNLPKRIRAYGTNPAVYSLTNTYVDQDISSDRYTLPAQPVAYDIPDRGWVRIPFETYFSLPLVKGWVGNSPALTFLVDLSLPFSVIDKTIASQLGLESSGKVNYPTRYPLSDFAITRIPSFLLREIDYHNKVFFVTDMMPPSINVQLPIHGILGADMFSNTAFSIDIGDELIYIYEPKGYRYEGAGDKLPLESDLTGYSLPCTVDGFDFQAEVATSLGDGLLMTTNSQAANVIRQSQSRSAEAFSTGLQYGIPEKIYNPPNIRLGTQTVPYPLVHIAEFPGSNPLSSMRCNWIGCGILGRFKATFDFTRDTAYLEPGKNFSRPSLYNTTGMYVIKSGGNVVVQRIVPGSAAAKAGLQPGDIIRQIGEYPVQNMVFDHVYRNLMVESGRQIPLKIVRGDEEKDITLLTQSPF